MLNRAPVPPYGFTIDVIHGGATLLLSTTDFPCHLENPDGYSNARADTFLSLAIGHGLHAFTNLKLPDGHLQLEEASQPWLFQLPTAARRAAVHGPNGVKLFADAIPSINQLWWRQAVMAGGRCNLITTTGLLAQAASRKLQPDTINSHGGHRFVGASIPVEF